MKKALIIALTVLCGAASAAIIGLNSKSDLSELTKANIEALAGSDNETGSTSTSDGACYGPKKKAFLSPATICKSKNTTVCYDNSGCNSPVPSTPVPIQ